MDKLKIYLDKDIDTNLIKTKKIAVIGFGSQGYGQSMNLKDSGCDVVLGLRLGGQSDTKAKDYGFKTMSIPEAVKYADIVQILIPDELQASVYEEQIKPYLKAGQYLMFSHGFNIHFKKIVAPNDINVIMVAPKGPGHTVRSEYQQGKGVPCLVAVEQNPSGDALKVALSYASAIGAGRAGVLETNFKEETETDLFGEQAVICGGVAALIKTGFDVLVEAGYSPYMAYLEVCHEMKLIVDLINQGGMNDMRYSISNTAEYGDMTRGPRVIGESARQQMKELLTNIQNGSFANEFLTDINGDRKVFNKYRTENQEHLMEKIGAEIRSSFVWNNDNRIIDRNRN
ncbi:MAG: ketol-acid reductoisomerase [Candidatus Gastranaerophilales bacterium]|nr:ketol-acid reductoisomerase [Candidatus Gastranaerophilales bacterium]